MTNWNKIVNFTIIVNYGIFHSSSIQATICTYFNIITNLNNAYLPNVRATTLLGLEHLLMTDPYPSGCKDSGRRSGISGPGGPLPGRTLPEIWVRSAGALEWGSPVPLGARNGWRGLEERQTVHRRWGG